MIALLDDELLRPWLMGVANSKPHRSGDFLRALGNAALRADHENYAILRPALLAIHPPDPPAAVPFGRAVLCLDCDHVTASRNRCEHCGSSEGALLPFCGVSNRIWRFVRADRP